MNSLRTPMIQLLPLSVQVLRRLPTSPRSRTHPKILPTLLMSWSLWISSSSLWCTPSFLCYTTSWIPLRIPALHNSTHHLTTPCLTIVLTQYTYSSRSLVLSSCSLPTMPCSPRVHSLQHMLSSSTSLNHPTSGLCTNSTALLHHPLHISIPACTWYC